MSKYTRTPESEARIVEAYKRLKTYKGVALEIGCSWNTAQRVVVKWGANPGQGKHTPGNNGGGSPAKITDAELIEESKTLSRVEIAEKHGMCISNVDRKLKRLGIKCRSGVGTGGKWHARMHGKNAAFDRSVTLHAVYDRFEGICQICGGKTDFMAKTGRHILADYPTVDHIVPISRGGSHTWANVQLACMRCNARKCDR